MYKQQKLDGQQDIPPGGGGYQSASKQQQQQQQHYERQISTAATMLVHSDEQQKQQQQQIMESAFLNKNRTVQHQAKYYENRAVDRLNNSYEMADDDDDEDNDDDVDDQDDERSKNGHVYEEFLRKPFHQQRSKREAAVAFRMRLTSPTVMPTTTTTTTIPDLLPNNVAVARPQQDDELDYEVDVDTVMQGDNPNQEDLTFLALKPDLNGRGDVMNMKDKTQATDCESFDDGGNVCLDRNARRPMNAFLIFCKRHRAIVKERYKSLENRAITKILGDWWASLDGNEKHCFTNLAQKNKDAFFNANPNFKWYKLPAPPLRSSTTRPNNNSLENMKQSRLSLINTYIDSSRTAIGSMKTLPNDLMKNDKRTIMQDNEHALQLALSETTQFFTNSMPTKSYYLKAPSNATEFVCSSSDDDDFNMPTTTTTTMMPNDKSARRCKGKIYQQLIKSGRIVAATPKRMKVATPMPMTMHEMPTSDGHLQQKHFMSHDRCAAFNATTAPTHKFSQLTGAEKCDNGSSFDLDNKIKELPALNFDAYLQRKHNTNKKKKFNTKKQRRAAAGAGVGVGNPLRVNKASQPTQAQIVVTDDYQHEKQPDANAVGSRKRKARKESITRRDISLIEQEISSIMPLTINGCYYFNECLADQPKSFAAQSNTVTSTPTPTLASPTISSSSSSSLSFDQLAADGCATTNASDLLILAEVAANRTD